MAPTRRKRTSTRHARTVTLYNDVSEDRLELLLDRFRSSIKAEFDWIGYIGSVAAVVASIISLFSDWRGSVFQIVSFGILLIFGSVVAYRGVEKYRESKDKHEMTNDEFINALFESNEAGNDENVKTSDVQLDFNK